MGTLNINADKTGAWKLSVTPTTADQKLTLSTSNKYLDRNIEITINKPTLNTATATLGDATITSGSATISSATYTWDATNTRFNVTGSATVSAPTVTTAGYISSSAGTKNTNTASLSTTVARVGTAVDISNGGASSVTISRTAKPSADTWTDAASGAATTSKPTSGVYVQVNSAANTKTLTATPKVSSAGYGTTSYYGSTASTSTVGASASAATYVPIKSAATPTLSITDKASTDIAVGTLSSGYYPLTASLTGSMTFDTAGWIPTTGASATDSSVTVGRIAAAAFSNVGTPTTNSTTGAGSGYIPLVTTAGYSPLNWINSLTVPTGKTFSTIVAENASTSANGGIISTITLGNANTDTGDTTGTTARIGGRITTINMGQGAQYTNSSGALTNVYSYISTIAMKPRSYITNIYTTDATGCTVSFGSDSHSSARTYPTIYIGSGTTSSRTTYAQGNLYIRGRNNNATAGYEDRINNLYVGESTTNKYARISYLYNYGTIADLRNYGTLAVRSGTDGLGTVTVNAYNDAATPALTGAKTIVSDGKWSKTTLNYASASGNYYGWISYTNPGMATCTVNGGGLSLSAPSGGELSKGTASGGGLSKGTASGGGLSGGGLTAGNGAVDASNVELSDTDNGIYVEGSGSVNRATINRATFSQTVTRASFSQQVTRASFSQTVTRGIITDTHTAGYLPAKSASTVIGTASTTVSLGSSSTTVSLGSASTTVSLASGSIAATSASSNKLKKFLRGVTIPKPTSGENTFYVTVPNGDSTITYWFHVASNGDVYVTDSATAVV